VSYAPTIDKLKTKEERRKAYAEALTAKPDIVESDRPVEIYEVLSE
ncbi:hypothetical protein SAMN05444274_1021, partial [Mariniphaga anaerophila]